MNYFVPFFYICRLMKTQHHISGLLIAMLVVILWITSACNTASTAKVNWLTWDEWNQKAELQDKKGLVWIHSPTCDDCTEMGKETFEHPQIVELINKNFHAIKLDVHHPDPITTKGKTWEHKPPLVAGELGYHDLARALAAAKDQIPYPTVTFLDEKFDLIVAIPQRLSPKELEVLMAFTLGEHYRDQSVEEFKKSFKATIR